ncbi:MAG: hypothetical protein H0V65_04745 [Chitinophagales bacterium]|nr:hypothetical protein [Chitinophagales bacterium]
MQKKASKIFKITTVILLTLLLTGWIIGLVFEEKIKEVAVKELNNQLATEAKIKGKISFSVFSNFPYASIKFNNVEIKETLPEKRNLLVCKKISFLFNIWDLLKTNYSIKKIKFEDGVLQIRKNAEGLSNYNIFKTTGSSSKKEFSLTIEEALLSNILISYEDVHSNQNYFFNTHSSILSGNLSSDNFILNIESDLFCKNLELNGVNYLPNRSITLNGSLNIDLSRNSYRINDTKITIEDNRFLLSGTVLSELKGAGLDLKFQGNDLRIEEISALLPVQYRSYFSHFKSKGAIHFNGSIVGMISKNLNPKVDIYFGINNGLLSHDKMNESFQRVNLTGKFSNGATRSLSSSSLELINFSTVFSNTPVSGSLILKNFLHPYLDMQLNGNVSLEKIQPLFPSNYITALNGTVALQRFFFRGNVDGITRSVNLNKIEAGGSFTLQDVSVTTKTTAYNQINGSFDINNNQISINRFNFKARESDLDVDGTINNFIPYLIASMNDSVKNQQKIGLNVKLTSQHLNWSDLVGTKTTDETKSLSSKDYPIPTLFYAMTGSVTGNIEKFSYDRFNASSLHGTILFLGNYIYFNDMGMNAENGNVTANGKLDITNVNRNLLDLTAKLDGLNISQLFYEFNNFDQTALTDKNLKGTVTSEVVLQAAWDERKFNKSKLYAIANMSVENGELNDFEPMMALGKFVKISELRNIRFSKLQNQIEIKNEKVFIPSMQIFTNALNVQLSGTHAFNNTIDYKVQLNLLKLLTSKFEKSSVVTNATEKSTEGFLNLYLTMTGAASDPLIQYDKGAVKEKITSDLKNEKKEFKDVLKKEFDKQEQDKGEIKDWQPPAEIEYMEFESDTIASEVNNEKYHHKKAKKGNRQF